MAEFWFFVKVAIFCLIVSGVFAARDSSFSWVEPLVMAGIAMLTGVVQVAIVKIVEAVNDR